MKGKVGETQEKEENRKIGGQTIDMHTKRLKDIQRQAKRQTQDETIDRLKTLTDWRTAFTKEIK